MRVLFVVERYGAEARGTPAGECRELATRLARRGHQIEVATSCARGPRDRADDLPPGTTLEDGVTVRRLPVRAPRDERLFASLHHRVVASDGPVAHVVAREWMRMLGPDVPDLASWLRSRARELQVVAFFSAVSATSYDGLRAVTGMLPTVLHPLVRDAAPLRLDIFDQMVRAAGAFVFCTDEERDLVVRRFGADGPSTVLGPGIASDAGTEAEPDVEGFRDRFDLGERPYLLFAAPVGAEYGSTELVEMFAARADRRGGDVALVALGEASLAPGTGLVVTGPVDEGTRTAAIAGCLALVQPSYAERLPTALLEAWARLRPALVQGRGGALVGEARRSGAAIPYAGFAEFEAAVDALVTSPDLATSLGRAGRRHVDAHHRWDAVLGRYERFLEEASVRWRPPHPTSRRPAGA